MKSPILYLVFNRVDEATQSFEIIKRARPSKLYIAADGPRKTVQGEREICLEVRNLVTNVDWDCEVHTLFREENLGCKKAIIDAINWFFEHEDEGIILEDDVIPLDDFFLFCDLMLEKYRTNEEIKAVNGFNQFGQNVESNSYFFSRGYYPWGWATWKSRWKNYIGDNVDISKLEDKNVKAIYDKAAIEGVKFNLKLVNKNILDTWDYQMVYMIMVQNGFVVTPFANLTSNIGVNGAHSLNNQNIFFKYGRLSIDSLQHPEEIEENKVMNEKLWDEYKEAYFMVRIKNILAKTGVYLPLRRLYKQTMKFYISLSK